MGGLTVAQRKVIAQAQKCLFTNTVLVVGGAGTGKSRTAIQLIKEVARRTSCLLIVACAAAAPLDKYRLQFAETANVLVMTLQSLVGIKPTEAATGIPKPGFRREAEHGGARFGPVPRTKKVVLVIEEVFAAQAELVNQAMRSLAHLPHAAGSADNVHALLVGCPHQMPPVGGTCVYHADIFHDDMRLVRRLVLTENKRCKDADESFLRLLHLLRYWTVLGEGALREADGELIALSQRGLPSRPRWIESVKLTATNAHAKHLNSNEARLRYARGEGTIVFLAFGKLDPEKMRVPDCERHAVPWLGRAVIPHPGGGAGQSTRTRSSPRFPTLRRWRLCECPRRGASGMPTGRATPRPSAFGATTWPSP